MSFNKPHNLDPKWAYLRDTWHVLFLMLEVQILISHLLDLKEKTTLIYFADHTLNEDETDGKIQQWKPERWIIIDNCTSFLEQTANTWSWISIKCIQYEHGREWRVLVFTLCVQGLLLSLPSRVHNKTLVSLKEHLPQGDLPNTSPCKVAQ